MKVFFTKFWHGLSALVVITVGCLLQWVLVGGASPVRDWLDRPPRIIENHADFNLGVVFPRWGRHVYGSQDPGWREGLIEMHNQTGAQWVEITVNLYQESLSATEVIAQPAMAPTPEDLAQGIRTARAMGYRVLLVPLLTVGGNEPWAGLISFATEEETQRWFDSYWQAYLPYVQAAQEAEAEALAIGTEFETLEKVAPHFWNQLIERAHATFEGRIQYDMNWSSLYRDEVAPWMRNPRLATIGVSVYIPLVDTPEARPDPKTLENLWEERALKWLDIFAERLGKKIMITEVGFRNRADAAFEPYLRETSAPPDPAMQAAGYRAVLANVMRNPNITGLFFWGWSVPLFQPNDLPAAQTIREWYTRFD